MGLCADTALHRAVAEQRHGGCGNQAEQCVLSLLEGLPEHLRSSWAYVQSTPVSCRPTLHYLTHGMLDLGMCAATSEGLVFEFGVFHGRSIRQMAEHFHAQLVHGFDSFSGIPTAWHLEKAGSYSTHGVLPHVPVNVKFHVGLFNETLPGFLATHAEPIRFMNIDCDLYCSTIDIFNALYDRVVPGTIIVFDEYVVNEHWQQDEYKAFQETVQRHGWTYEYLGISLVSKQAIVRILSV